MVTSAIPRRSLCILLFFLNGFDLTNAFVLKLPIRNSLVPLFAQSTTEASSMRVGEIKDELEKLNIDFTDCFDKESLVSRLVDARSGKVQPSESSMEESPADEETKTQDEKEDAPPAASTSSGDEEFDKDAALEEIRGMRVKQLREVSNGTFSIFVQRAQSTLSDLLNRIL